MLKKAPVILSVVGAAAMAVLSMTGMAQAKKAGDWTCSDFLQVPNKSKPYVVYWLTGLNKADKKEFLDVGAKDFNAPISKVVEACHKEPAQNLWQAIADHFYWKAMQIP
ncbi:HdeA/HdeB family chaperone [Methylocapsa sp. D3K7]|uniref:HdeA/HdeB family chaperone n=1 Tax=Methylocapsa sp. D3K7 TaxID=3041435 RepID=UPI00244EAADC|nr:HdeA/HdeB family chaperone [Methylocapsa sp. D3K7]WGJ13831.1 HdeA/HdeB family chaperone [Methylocapsa sp. D3K7]